MSLVLYDGPSRLDFKTPIVLLATERTSNRKTGDMLQTWILTSRVDPITAVKTNQDAAICGQCVHRGDGFKNRSCYVHVAYGALSAWSGPREDRRSKLEATGARQFVRLGSYGDPAAVPYEIWERLLSRAEGWTGYTHQWRTCDQRLKRFCMASVENEGQRELAKRMGWRTFRIGTDIAQRTKNEVLCPASAEAGHKLTCRTCMYCSGSDGKRGDVFIPVHGSSPTIRAFRSKVAAPGKVAVISIPQSR